MPLPNPQLGKVQTLQDKHKPPWPNLDISSLVTLSSAISRGKIRSNMVRLEYITQPGSPIIGILPS